MLTLRQAAALLAAAASIRGLAAIASELGLEQGAVPLDAEARGALGIPDDVTEASIVRGQGAIRALLVVAPGDPPLRSLFARLSTALSARTRHLLWLVVGATESGEVGIACWSGASRSPRVAALVARRERIVASDAESVCALASAARGDDLLVHTQWHELLGREALSRRFYRTLEQRVLGLAESLRGVPADDRAELALLVASRLLFLSFLEAKGWLAGQRSFLAARFDDCMSRGGRLHERLLFPLWFGTLNTPMRKRADVARGFGAIPFLNGGLFARTAVERRHARARFSDAELGRFFAEILGAHRFTAREEQHRWTEAAIDPEMLGRAFESLMAVRERRVSGAFYTPQPLVAHVAERALDACLGDAGLPEDVVAAARRGELLAGDDASALRAALASLTVLDPACGSGAFLVYLLERLAHLHVAAGDARPLSEVRRSVLTRSIHGVDVNPTAVWLCELRLWLSVVIESEETRMHLVPPLPNLDGNIRVGDALAGDAFSEPPSLVGPSVSLVRLRDRYARASGPRKSPLRRALAAEERRRALAVLDRQLLTAASERRERLIALRSRDLFGARTGDAERRDASLELRRRCEALRRERRRIADGGALPFAFASHFGHVHAGGGFQLVVGNPPWVRLHNIPAPARAALRARFRVFRAPAWSPATDDSTAGRGFGAQVDLAALFVERSLALLAPRGVMALLLPAKLWRSLSGGGVRELLATSRLLRIEDWSGAPCAFDAAVYPSIVVAMAGGANERAARAAVQRRAQQVEWSTAPAALRLRPADVASPWLLLPPDARRAFERLLALGTPLRDCQLGQPTLGVKCGCNDAFTVETESDDAEQTIVSHRGRRGSLERAVLRPLLRGESVERWRVTTTRGAIVWTHAIDGAPLTALPAQTARWLAPWRRRLAARSDLRGSRAWWSLFRTEGADPNLTRVVWSDFGRVPRAALLPVGDPTVPLNSCYVLACADLTDALALAALLNSPLAAAWLNAVAEPARGGWHRYLAWTVSMLPLPRDWAHARRVLAPLAERALLGCEPTDTELLSAACRAFRLRSEDVAPLIAWSEHA